MSSFHNNALVGAAGQSGYQISRSLRFNSADSAYLNWTPASAGNRKTWTWSGWVKRAALSTDQALLQIGTTSSDSAFFRFRIDSTNSIRIGGGLTSWRVTTPVYRDSSAWYHIVLAIDTTDATANNRIRLYINGAEVTGFGTLNNPTQNADLAVNNAAAHNIGRDVSGADYFSGYLTEIHFIDGQALTPSSFGETDTITGVWKPKKYAGTYGTNGFYLNFADNSGTTATTLGKDSSGNGNNWTPNNFSVTAGAGNDSLVDSPTRYGSDTGAGGEVRGNYCTGNPLYAPSTNSRMSLTNGNLEWGQAATNAVSSMAGTFAMRSGKWYWEVTVGGALTYSAIGIQTDVNTAWRGGGTVLYRSDGQKVIGGTSSAYGASFTTNDVLGFAYDADAGTLTCYKNNTSQGTIYSSGAGNVWLPCAHDDNAGSGVTYYHQTNFGQRPFAYTAPSGFKALCTTNLPEPTLVKGSSYMDVKTWTSTGTDPVVVSGLGFSPDLVWAKGRNDLYNHVFVDQIRGVNNVLSSNLTNSEASYTTVTQFNSDGFNAGGTANNNYSLNSITGSTRTYVAWCWDAGSSTVTNTSGTISSQVRANASAGFSVVTYTGTGANATVGHGLGVAPSMIIIKDRTSGTANWITGHTSIGWGNRLYLNDTSSSTAAATTWNSTAPTSTVFSIGTSTQTNANTDNHVAYCFSAVAGYSAFGSYTGNGSSDGPFVFTGFRPRWLMIKRTDSAANWQIYDTARDTSNRMFLELVPNSSAEENSISLNIGVAFDFTSNGFKLRDSDTAGNASGGTYVWAAFAENPFKYSLAR